MDLSLSQPGIGVSVRGFPAARGAGLSSSVYGSLTIRADDESGLVVRLNWRGVGVGRKVVHVGCLSGEIDSCGRRAEAKRN